MGQSVNHVEPARWSLWSFLGFGMRDEGMIDWRTEDPTADDWWKPGAVVVDIEFHVSFADRLRILLSGRAAATVSTRTDVLVRRAESRTVLSVLAPKWLDKRPEKQRAP